MKQGLFGWKIDLKDEENIRHVLSGFRSRQFGEGSVIIECYIVQSLYCYGKSLYMWTCFSARRNRTNSQLSPTASVKLLIGSLSGRLEFHTAKAQFVWVSERKSFAVFSALPNVKTARQTVWQKVYFRNRTDCLYRHMMKNCIVQNNNQKLLLLK